MILGITPCVFIALNMYEHQWAKLCSGLKIVFAYILNIKHFYASYVSKAKGKRTISFWSTTIT